MFIARKSCDNSYKDSLVKAYGYYAKFYGIAYVKPKFKSERRLPRIPSREVILSVVSASSKKVAVIFKILIETGAMPFELANVVLRDIDLEKGTLMVRGFEGHASRVFKLKSDIHVLLTEYVSEHYGEKPFPDAHWIARA